MTTVKDIESYLAERIPYNFKEDWDNVGLLVGETRSPVKRILVSLDITTWTIEEARHLDAQLIVSHHPMFFGLKSITDKDPTGSAVIKLISSGIAAICLHTNLDSVKGGVNDVLIEKLGAVNLGVLDQAHESDMGEYGLGRFGELPEALEMKDFLPKLRSVLGTNGLRFHDAGRPVSRVAVCGGSGGEFIERAMELGCDTYLTADIKYDRFLTARELGINLIDGDHFCTENLVVPMLAGMLRDKFGELEVLISEEHGQTAKFFV